MCAGTTSMPAVSVGRITSVHASPDRPRARRPSSRRSVLRLIPTPAVRFACGSMSTSRTLKPSSASAPARLIAVVVLPTPPFWLAIAITCVKGSPRGLRAARREAGGRREWGNATPRPNRAPVEVVHTLPELCTVLWISAARGPRIIGCRADITGRSRAGNRARARLRRRHLASTPSSPASDAGPTPPMMGARPRRLCAKTTSRTPAGGARTCRPTRERIARLEQLRAEALQGGGPVRVERQHAGAS